MVIPLNMKKFINKGEGEVKEGKDRFIAGHDRFQAGRICLIKNEASAFT